VFAAGTTSRGWDTRAIGRPASRAALPGPEVETDGTSASAGSVLSEAAASRNWTDTVGATRRNRCAQRGHFPRLPNRDRSVKASSLPHCGHGISTRSMVHQRRDKSPVGNLAPDGSILRILQTFSQTALRCVIDFPRYQTYCRLESSREGKIRRPVQDPGPSLDGDGPGVVSFRQDKLRSLDKLLSLTD
jgi:hypothetical protein